MGIARSRDDPEPELLPPQFRMTIRARHILDALEGPDSLLCQCLDTFPQFVTSYVATDAHAAGIAKDSK